MKRKPRDKGILCQKVSQQQVTPEKEDGLTGRRNFSDKGHVYYLQHFSFSE